MILIADSGSTKTDWVLTDGTGAVQRFQTQGINPFHQSEDDILAILREVQLAIGNTQPSDLPYPTGIAFYGSGVRPELESHMVHLLQKAIPTATDTEAHSDLLGAARAVCGMEAGVACILGTGSNSGLYDGKAIVQNTPPLGYILGDEGSGAVLGIRFCNALYKGFMPSRLLIDFQNDIGLTMADIITHVYRQPMANRFLASLSPFISRHLCVPEVYQLVVDNFRDFFRRNVAQYRRPDLPVSFVGSIAYCYADQLREAAAAEGFHVGTVMKSPMDGLVAYHCQ